MQHYLNTGEMPRKERKEEHRNKELTNRKQTPRC
jgi:hypothetical protein